MVQKIFARSSWLSIFSGPKNLALFSFTTSRRTRRIENSSSAISPTHSSATIRFSNTSKLWTTSAILAQIHNAATASSSASRRRFRLRIGDCDSGFSLPAACERLIQSAALISSLACAESLFEKAQDCPPCATPWREEIEARQAASRKRLDQAEFYHERLDPLALYQTLGHTRTAAFSKSAARTNLHHLDRTRVVSDPNARHERSDRSDLVDVAQRDQATQRTGLSHPSFAVDRFRPRHARALRSSRSPHVATRCRRPADRRSSWRWAFSSPAGIQHCPRAGRM